MISLRKRHRKGLILEDEPLLIKNRSSVQENNEVCTMQPGAFQTVCAFAHSMYALNEIYLASPYVNFIYCFPPYVFQTLSNTM